MKSNKVLDERKTINDILVKQKMISVQKNLLQMNNTERDKQYDCKRLKEMVCKIDAFKNNEIGIIYCLSEIGKLSSGISYNNDENGIRNKYGYIQRNTGKIYENGIWFERLSQLERILNDIQIYSKISHSELEFLTNDLSCLKQKVIYVLKKCCIDSNEISFNEMNGDLTAKITSIIDFVNRHYETLISRLIKIEIEDWDTIEQTENKLFDFAETDDRYFFMTSFSKIGESLNEFIKGTSVNKNSRNEENFLLKSFRNLIKIRNINVHGDNFKPNEPDRYKNINITVMKIRRHLSQVFCKPENSSERYFINYRYENAETFQIDSEILLLYLSGNQKTEINDGVKSALDKLVIEAGQKFQNIEGNREKKLDRSMINKLKIELKGINKQYQSTLILCRSNEIDVSGYPPLLDMGNKNNIMSLCTKLSQVSSIQSPAEHFNRENKNKSEYLPEKLVKVEIRNTTKELSHKEDDENEDIISILSKMSLTEIRYCTEVCLKIQESLSVETHDETVGNLNNEQNIKSEKFPLVNNNTSEHTEINNLTNKLNDNVELINNEIKYYRDVVSRSFNDKLDYIFSLMTASEKLKFLTDLQYRMDKICKELNPISAQISSHFVVDELYSYETKILRFPKLKKYEYIIKHSMLVIVQLILDSAKDRDAINLSINQDVNMMVPSHIQKYVNSILIDEGKKSCNRWRSKGLAHNLECFNRDSFLSNILDTLNVFNQMDSFLSIMQRDSSSSVNGLLKTGASYFRTYSYSESLKYFEKALGRAESHPDEIENHEIDKIYVDIFGKPRLIYTIQKLILCALLMTFQRQRMYEKCKEMVESVDLEKLRKLDNVEIKNEINFLYCGICYHLIHDQGNYNDARKLLIKADNISDHYPTKVLLAQVYMALEDYEETRKMCKYISQSNARSIDKFASLKLLLDCDSEHPNSFDLLSEMRDAVQQMELIYDNDIQYFKALYRDAYLVWDIDLMISKLYLMLVESRHLGLNEANLALLNEIDSKFQYVKGRLREETSSFEWGQFYLLCCKNFCSVYDEGNLDLDSSGKYLKTAKEYLDNYSKVLNSVGLYGNSYILLYRQFYQRAALELVYAHVNFVNQSPPYLDFTGTINFLLEALQLADGYDVTKTDVWINLGKRYFHQARMLSESENVIDNQYPDLAVQYFKESEKYFVFVSKGFEKEGDFGTKFDSSQCYLAACKQNISQLQFDLRLIWDSIQYSKKILNSSSFCEEYFVIQKWTNNLEQLFSNVIEVMRQILNHHNKSIKADEYTINYCKKKWNIDISHHNEILNWTYNGDLSINELRNCIEMELSFVDQ